MKTQFWGIVTPVLGAVVALAAGLAHAHHSAALFYDVEGRITVTGTVTEFRFANPHAILEFEVVGDDGGVQHWTAETTSPSILRRRGWSQQSFTPGETITLEGMPSINGDYLMRITRAFHEDGSEIGVPRGTDN
jgi:DNA/RNA endonuclease YhcR with UshA esterase domain